MCPKLKRHSLRVLRRLLSASASLPPRSSFCFSTTPQAWSSPYYCPCCSAHFLHPAVEFLERFRIPRAVGSLIMVLILISSIAAGGYVLYARIDDFAAEWPKYKGTLRDATGTIQGKISGIEGSVSELTTSGPPAKAPAPSADSSMVHNFLVRGIGSWEALVLEATFVPFLVFFMLAQKREVWHATLQLFPVNRRTQGEGDSRRSPRRAARLSYRYEVAVTLVVIALSSMFFLALGFDYPVLAGIASGIFNMVPYIGAVLAWLPGFMLAIIKYHVVRNFALIAFVLTGIHVVAQNLIAPQLVGRQGAFERRGHHHSIALLGMGLGRHGFDSRHSDYCRASCNSADVD